MNEQILKIVSQLVEQGGDYAIQAVILLRVFDIISQIMFLAGMVIFCKYCCPLIIKIIAWYCKNESMDCPY